MALRLGNQVLLSCFTIRKANVNVSTYFWRCHTKLLFVLNLKRLLKEGFLVKNFTIHFANIFDRKKHKNPLG